MIQLPSCSYATVEDFVAGTNKARLANKGYWFTWHGLVVGNEVALKNYNTYLQVFRINGTNHASGRMDMSITVWKEELREALPRLDR